MRVLVVPSFFVALAGLSLLSLAVASPTESDRLTLRQTVTPPHGWTRLGRAPSTHVLELRIALPQSRFPELERHIAEISEPSHPRYGEYLSKEAVEELVAPHPSSVDAVRAWLTGHGTQWEGEDCHRSPAGDWVTVHVPVAQAEKMLSTEFGVWKHDRDGDVLVRTTEYSLPTYLDEHIELVQPTTAFHRAKGLRTTYRLSPLAPETSPSFAAGDKITVPGTGVTVDASCKRTITVSCLKQLYNAAGYVPRAPKGNNTIALTGYLGEFANFADLRRFYADQVPHAINTSFDVVLVDGGQNSQTTTKAGIEANLDMQFALGISFPIPGTFYSTGGEPPYIPDANTPKNTNEPYLTWLDFVLAQEKIPQTISTSYGDNEQTVPADFARRVCAGFAQFGARGTSLIFSSGDHGVGDGDSNPKTQSCFTNDGKNRTRFLPIFPASCPYVTAVGGTTSIPEVAAEFSGGGFSNVFPRPAYQDTAVKRFLQSLPKGTYAGLFNPHGRAIPDVSAQAEYFRMFWQGHPLPMGGTSASAPTFAGLVALLNDARIAAGRPPLGFLNPLLYHICGGAFNDITVGNAPGCGTPGFNATAGWDPVTGLGTPDFEKLRKLLLKF